MTEPTRTEPTRNEPTRTEPTRTEAQQLLDAAERGAVQADAVTGRSRIGGITGIGIGVLVGAFLLAGVFVLPVATLPVALVVSGAYALGIVAFTTAYNAVRRVVPAGWVRRFHLGLVITMAVFAIGLALSFLTPERSLLLWIPLALACALPIAILATVRAAR